MVAFLLSSDRQVDLDNYIVAMSLSMTLDIKHGFDFFLWGGVSFHGNGNGLDKISCSVVMLPPSPPIVHSKKKYCFPFLDFCKKSSKGIEKESQVFTLQNRLFGMRRIHKWVTVLSLVTEAGSTANVP